MSSSTAPLIHHKVWFQQAGGLIRRGSNYGLVAQVIMLADLTLIERECGVLTSVVHPFPR
jgi:hypothetical protein